MNKTNSIKSKTDQKYVNILGINILSTSTNQLLTAVDNNISDSHKFTILTPNPELVLASTTNSKLKEALNSATFTIPDGVGLLAADNYLQTMSKKSSNAKLFVSWFKSFYLNTFKPREIKSNLNLIKGRELMLNLVEMAEKKGWKIFLLGGKGNEAVLTAEHLISLYPNIIVSTSKGPNLNDKGEPDTKVDNKVQSDILKRINMLKPDLLFVAFGNPKQEIWIHDNLNKLGVGGAMAVGGTFRYLSGIAPFPPKWIENLGLEWFWRLITEPGRVRRIWNAVVVFPITILVKQ